MKLETKRSEIENLIHKISIESGQTMESVQWEHEPINEEQLKNAVLEIEKNINLLKKILGE